MALNKKTSQVNFYDDLCYLIDDVSYDGNHNHNIIIITIIMAIIFFHDDDDDFDDDDDDHLILRTARVSSSAALGGWNRDVGGGTLWLDVIQYY